MAGNTGLYFKLLRQFADQQPSAMTQLKGALAANDRETAERLAHTLKGVAGNLGATAVQSAAGALETAIRAKAPAAEIETKRANADAVLGPLLDQLKSHLAAPAAAAAVPAAPKDPGQIRAAVKELVRLLADFDARATSFAEENQALLRTAFQPGGFAKFMQHVQGFEFAEAQTLLEEAMAGR